MNIARLKVDGSARFKLHNFAPDDTHGVSKSHAASAFPVHVEKLAALHDLLYAEHKRSLLIVLQGMDAAGKDGTIRHVMSGVNPQGCSVTSFKQPSALDLMTSSGESMQPCRRRALSEFLTVPTMKMC
jgi:polyphosphate kinase 2 (PPK2 family)